MKKRVTQRRGYKDEQDGFVMLTVVVIFLLISLGAALTLASIIYRESAVVRNSVRSVQSIYVSEALQEDLLYRFIGGMDVPSVATLALNGAEAEATVEDVSGAKRVISVGDAESRIRKTEMVLSRGSGASFFYGVQTGQGGFEIGGSGRVLGNLYSNGIVRGSWASEVTGDVVSAGPSGKIDLVRVGGSAYAQRIEDSWVDGDAHFQSIYKTDVEGSEFPGSPNMPELPLPITDEQIDVWKSEAEAGGVYTGSCPYNIGGVANVNVGNIKVPCDMNIAASSRVTITGPIWVEGDLDIGGAAKITIDPDLEGVSVPIVADDPSNRNTSSMIDIGGSAELSGAGEGSFFILVSQNESAENGGSRTAIDMGGGGPGSDLLLYAPHGEVTLGGSAKLTGISAYLVEISGSATVEYKEGLANLVFSSGPSGGYVLESLGEIQ